MDKLIFNGECGIINGLKVKIQKTLQENLQQPNNNAGRIFENRYIKYQLPINSGKSGREINSYLNEIYNYQKSPSK